MTIWLYLQCAFFFLLGQAIELFLFKIPELRKMYTTANEKLSMRQYWQHDWNLIVGTQLVGILAIAGLDELIHWKPIIIDYVKYFFAGFGAWGTSIIISKYSQARKYIINIIDKKTNIADEIPK